MGKVNLIEHPLLWHSLTMIRDKNTGTADFRRHSGIVSQIIIMEATRGLQLQRKDITTPLTSMIGYEARSSVVFVPVLRAGISMLMPAKDFIPWAPVGFIGLERDEETAIAREYYQKFPKNLEEKHVLVLRSNACHRWLALRYHICFKEKGASTISAVCIVAAPEGIDHLQQIHPKVEIYTAAVDDHLDENKFIVPGLGDFGDRYFGT